MRNSIIKNDEQNTARFMVMPAAVIILVLGVCPLLYVLWLSVNEVNPVTLKTTFAGLKNYKDILDQDDFWKAMGNTAYFTVVSLSLQIVLGVMVALLLHQNFKGRWFVRTVFLLPWTVPTLVNANLWKWMLNTSYGIINKILIATGIIDTGIFWLGKPFLTMNCVIFVDTWRMMPMVALMFLAAFQTVPDTILEAASIDGAGAFRKIWSIYLPSIKPMILVVLVLRTIQAFRVFDIIFSMTRGGPDNGTMVISFFAYQEIYNYLHYGKGAAIALIILIVMVLLSMVYAKLLNEKV